jgi:GNAT superfamily N-acetyltransferase
VTLAIRAAAAAEVVDVRHAILRRGRPRATAIFPGDDGPHARHWVAERDGTLVGVVSVLPAPMPDPPANLESPPTLQLRGMAILEHEQGRGVGRLLLETVHRDVGRPMWCNARVEVVEFYARHGWKAVGPVFHIPEVGAHRRMWGPSAG